MSRPLRPLSPLSLLFSPGPLASPPFPSGPGCPPPPARVDVSPSPSSLRTQNLCVLSPEPHQGLWLRWGRPLCLSPSVLVLLSPSEVGPGWQRPQGHPSPQPWKGLWSSLPLLPSELAVPPCNSPSSIKSSNGCESSGSGEISIPSCAFSSFQDQGKRLFPIPLRPQEGPLFLRLTEAQDHHLLAPFPSNPEEGPLHSSFSLPPLPHSPQAWQSS